MIKIEPCVKAKQKNFWNNCVFHPTDAIEDAWGARILDKISADKAINAVRIYAMLEDIVYLDENGELCYDFRLSDLRLDYMLEKGFDVLLSYAGIPDCIASSLTGKTSVSKNKTRYKGKLWNTSPPKDYALWEEVCYRYTLHNLERYGQDVVTRWRCQCFNEPDINWFFFAELSDEEGLEARAEAYCKMYHAFAKGVLRACEKIEVGGPALALYDEFLDKFLSYVKKNNLRLDFISLHNYGTKPDWLNDGSRPFCVDDIISEISQHFEVIKANGFENTPVLIDEWGMSNAGFYNREECPALLAREHELFSAYFVKLIRAFIDSGLKVEMLAVCLSGQHEMTEDFSGFRNFFTLNFIKKPIYNAFILASRLGDSLLEHSQDNADVAVIPTQKQNGEVAVLLSYATRFFDENASVLSEQLILPESLIKKTVSLWCIDRENTNPYRLYQKICAGEPTQEELVHLREEGNLKPIKEFVLTNNSVSLTLTPNCTYFLCVK